MPVHIIPLACDYRRFCVTNISHIPNFSHARLSVDGGGASIMSFDRDTGQVKIVTLSPNYYFSLYVDVSHRGVMKEEVNTLSTGEDTIQSGESL